MTLFADVFKLYEAFVQRLYHPPKRPRLTTQMEFNGSKCSVTYLQEHFLCDRKKVHPWWTTAQMGTIHYIHACQSNRYEHRINLQRTSTVQFLVSFPMIFSARHRYTPPSVRLMFKKSSLSSEITSPVLSMIHSILGAGLPVALHQSVALSPSITGVEHWCNVTFGATEKNVHISTKPSTWLKPGINGSLC